MTRPRPVREFGRAISRHRRLLAAALAAASVAVSLQVVQPPPPDTATVLAAARDLPGGTALAADDLRPVEVPPEVVPSGAIRPGDDRAGGVLAAPMRAGEALTNVRLVGPGLARGYGPDLVAAPVRIADPDVARLLRVGDRVDVLAVPNTHESFGEQPHTLARLAPVAAVPAADGAISVDGGLVVLAVPAEVAADLAHQQIAARLTVVVRPTP